MGGRCGRAGGRRACCTPTLRSTQRSHGPSLRGFAPSSLIPRPRTQLRTTEPPTPPETTAATPCKRCQRCRRPPRHDLTRGAGAVVARSRRGGLRAVDTGNVRTARWTWRANAPASSNSALQEPNASKSKLIPCKGTDWWATRISSRGEAGVILIRVRTVTGVFGRDERREGRTRGRCRRSRSQGLNTVPAPR